MKITVPHLLWHLRADPYQTQHKWYISISLCRLESGWEPHWKCASIISFLDRGLKSAYLESSHFITFSIKTSVFTNFIVILAKVYEIKAKFTGNLCEKMVHLGQKVSSQQQF